MGILLCAGIYIWNSWNRDFWAPEEPDFAAVIKEMERDARNGQYLSLLTPKMGGEIYVEKPPLIYWCAFLARLVTGTDPRFAYRLPVVIAAVLSLWVTYLAGRRFLDGRIAAVACLIQASSFLHFNSGSWFLTDMLFASTCGLAVISLGICIIREPGNLRWALLGWFALSIAALSKSALLAPVLILGPVFLSILLKPGGPGIIREVLQLRPLWGFIVFLALVAPWYVFMYLEHGREFLEIHFLEHHISRLVKAESHGGHTFFYYFKMLPVHFLPWSFFIPLAIFYGKVRFRQSGPRFFMIWVFFTFFFLSFISSKQGKYLLPMWPALSLLVAAALLCKEKERESVWETFLGEGLLRILAWALKVPIAVIVAVLAFWLCFDLFEQIRLLLGPRWESDVQGILENRALMIKLSVLALLAGAGFYAAGVGIGRRLREARLVEAVTYLGGATLFAYLALSFTYGDLNQFKSARALGDEVTKVVGDYKLAMYGRNNAAVHYYVGRRVIHLNYLDYSRADSEEERKLDEYLASEKKVYLLISESDLEELLSNCPKYEKRIHPVLKELRLGSRRRAILATNGEGD